jgi:hypothetical protein
MQQSDAIEGKGKGKVWFHLLEFIFYSKARFDRDYVFLDQDGVREKQNYRGRQKIAPTGISVSWCKFLTGKNGAIMNFKQFICRNIIYLAVCFIIVPQLAFAPSKSEC